MKYIQNYYKMFDIQFSTNSMKYLKKLKNKDLKERLLKSIFLLKLNPFPKGNFKFIEPKKDKIRIRVGNYRILYSIKEKELVILIISIDKRSRIYNH